LKKETMPPEFNPNEAYFSIRLTAGEAPFPTLVDITNFLYDFNILYEIARLTTDPTYSHFRFSRFVFYRKGRPLELSDRLRIQSISLGSPLLILAVLGAVPTAVGAVWGLVQIADKLTNAPLNRRKLKAEIEKLERENLLASTTPHNELAGWLNTKRAIHLEEDENVPEGQKSDRNDVQEEIPLSSVIRTTEGFRRVLRIRESETYYDQVANRLERSSIRIRELEIEVIIPKTKRDS
jgi:hypothetical protein